MEKKPKKQQANQQNDARVFNAGELIFCEADLKELINTTYAEYRYKGTQLDKLVRIIDFLTHEDNQYSAPELVVECQRVNDYLNTLLDFLQRNFIEGERNTNDEIIYCLQTGDNSYENEAFLVEFQMVSMDVEKAYKNYRAAVLKRQA
jgi:hypothetical protein